jgi:predicted Zn-dependent peptidase
VRQTSIDGVPVFQAEGPLPLTAGLVFGVGRADETFVRGGLTHLVEHLAMSAVGRQTIDANASST